MIDSAHWAKGPVGFYYGRCEAPFVKSSRRYRVIPLFNMLEHVMRVLKDEPIPLGGGTL